VSTAEIIDVIREAFWVLIQVSSPLLLVALFVGLLISFFQALTQIQEVALTFVPKILAILGLLFLLLPWYGDIFQVFVESLFLRMTLRVS
jgi:flagellar biosynthetic protein FliQ